LAAGLSISVAVWRNAENNLVLETRLRFDASSSQALAALQRRIEAYQALLRGMQGLFIASEQVDRRQFQRYSANLLGQLRIPGIRALHFTRHVLHPDKAAFVAAVRQDRSLDKNGYPDFSIRPESRQDDYFVIDYIEPFDENRRAFGLDASSQVVNRESFLTARDTGNSSITPPFQLIQTRQGERGLVLRAPVYLYGAPLTTVAERRRAFVGLVGISLNANDIFSDIFTEPYLDGLRISIHDVMRSEGGERPVPVSQLISEHRIGYTAGNNSDSAFSSGNIIPVGERLWEVRVNAGEDWLGHQHANDTPEFILAAGICISLLMAALYLALARSKTHADMLAAEMTLSLRRSEQRFRAMAEMSSDWFWEQDTEGRFVSLSGAGGDIGAKAPMPLEELMGKTRWELFPSALTSAQWEAHRRQLQACENFEMEYPMRDLQGNERWMNVHGAPRFGDSGVLLGYHGTAHEVTVRKMAEVEIARQATVLQATLDNMAQGISVVDGDLRMVAWNRRFCEILDFPQEMGHPGALFETFIRYNAERGEYGRCDVDAKVSEMLARAKAMLPHRFKRTRPNGCVVEVVGNPLPDGGFVTTYTDVTEQERAEQAIRVSEARLRRAELASRAGNWELHLDSQCMIVSAGAAKIYGVDGEKFEYEYLKRIPLREYRDVLDAALGNLVENDQPYDVEFRIETADTGEIKDIHSTAVFDREAGVLFGVIQEITGRKQAEARLQLAASVFTYAREGITITDAGGAIVEVNQAFTDITGYSREEVLGQNSRIFKSERQPPEFYTGMWRDLLGIGHWTGEIWNRRKNGEVYAEMLTVSAVRDVAGKVLNYVSLFVDITPMKEYQQQLEQMAHFDTLTGLPNRLLQADRLQQAMAQCQRRNRSLAVVYLDLDGFKAVNDRHGHDVGDELLIAIAQRMKAALRDGDTLARLGGDEFVAVLVDLERPEDCEPVLERLLQAAAGPVMVGDFELQVSASIGVTIYPQDEADADQLMRHADQAMYAAKQAGKNRYFLFDVAQDVAVKTQHESLGRIRVALDQREFVLYYQPKVNMKSGQVIGAEALIRWQHPEQGLLPPAAFLPVIENHSISVELGHWVIDMALAQMAEWQSKGLTLPVSVNVGARQLQQGDFVQRLVGLLDAHPEVQPNWLQLEILETSALEDVAQVSTLMHSCLALGVSFALDDFGTGYSSLTYLKHLPADLLKIDQSFVRDMLIDPDDLAIVEGVMGLAKTFRRQIIAEGVETVAHGDLLLTLGCELAQGYGIARPMPAREIPGWLATWRPDSFGSSGIESP